MCGSLTSYENVLHAHLGTEILEATSGRTLTLQVTRKGHRYDHGWVLTIEDGPHCRQWAVGSE